MRIDSHHHLWRYNASDYGWISDDQASLRRDFLLEDLKTVLRENRIDGSVAIQARQTITETDWLLALANEPDSPIRGVVGFLPLAAPEFPALLERYAGHRKLKGLRHVVQDEPDDRFLLRDDFNRGVAQLAAYHLTYDLLIFERQLPAALEFVDRHPDQPLVVDHIAKPRIRDGVREPWARNLRELARRPNVWCKLSGVVTEADPRSWTPEQLRPYLETVLACFGAERLMFGSDWPVVTVAGGYARWREVVEALVQELSPTEQAAFWSGNAIRFYQLER